ncbi:MAG: hypothetical protein KAI24_09165, partial [Planctomycetes bacterium]|nr:hypothetical protein [Planctomycetota bacterium]
PEPSPEFVNRTIAALEHDAPRHPATATTARSRGNLTMWGLLSAAAAALLWLALADDTRKPLELRLADRAPTAVSYAEATSPMAAILSGVADQEEPHAVFDEPADGLWLFGEGGEVR